jgi:hypothetical protein
MSDLDVSNTTLNYPKHASSLKALKYQTWILCLSLSDMLHYTKARIGFVLLQMSDLDASKGTLSYPKHAPSFQMSDLDAVFITIGHTIVCQSKDWACKAANVRHGCNT